MEKKQAKKIRVKTWVLYLLLLIQLILLLYITFNTKLFIGVVFVLYMLSITIIFTLNKIVKRLTK